MKTRRRSRLLTVALFATCAVVVQAQSTPPIPSGDARIHYYRADGNYAGWGLYTWNASTENNVWCQSQVNQAGFDAYGVYYDVAVSATQGAPAGDLGFILNNCAQGGIKDSGSDQHLPTTQNQEAWVIQGNSAVFTTQPTPVQIGNSIIAIQQAYWLDRSRVLIQPQFVQNGATYAITTSQNGGLTLTNGGVTGGTNIPLTPGGALTQDELARYPQLRGYAVFTVPSTLPQAAMEQALRGELALSVVANGRLSYVTGIQCAGVLDDLFYYSGQLGVIFQTGSESSKPVTINVWAPTAQNVALEIFNNATDTTAASEIPMTEQNGVWTAAGPGNWNGKYYLFKVTVWVPSDGVVETNTTTDPYSVDIALNGTKSRITNLDSKTTKPPGWDSTQSPALASISDLSLYELHIRDFSVNDSTVPVAHRGMYAAFDDQNSNGMQHLHALAQSGLKAVHLLPSFHFASINEDKSTWRTTGDLSQFPPDGQQQQAAVAAIQNSDAYNWGYDPVHYMTPEGSYAIDPANRVKEYRVMVNGLHKAGLRVIQDVVFNHTSASGVKDPNSNLDVIVPGYYHRLDANGNLETATCCADTASEHRMMEKLMIDALLLNAREYKIDGFRFDLMSFHFTYNMQHIQEALRALTPAKDGVDGSKIYLYGEGWNFGDTENSQIGPNADQLNLYGSGIGTFNDRIRDGIRGSGNDPRIQGFATGLFTDSSDYTNTNPPPVGEQAQLLHYSDWILVGLTGNLHDYAFVNSAGSTVTGAQVDYNGQPTGYTASPIEAINYCSAHDNQALFDAVQLKANLQDSSATRARRQLMAMSLIELGQGIPFFQAGDDMLRSKDMDQNSYDSGDWFNKIDWTGKGVNWGIGLPVSNSGDQNSGQWPIMQPLLSNSAYTPAPANISYAAAAFGEFLQIRYSSQLFRMSTMKQVQQNLKFLNSGPNQIPGLIIMKLDANAGTFTGYQHLLVVFNATNAPVTFTDASLQGLNLSLHPVQKNSPDPATQLSTFDSQQGSVTVQALTTAVFVGGTAQ